MIFNNKTSCVLSQLSFLLLFLFGCTGEAPRDNPLDPGSDLYDPTVTVRGFCSLLYETSTPVPGVDITLVRADSVRFTTTSDRAGRFSFSNMSQGVYELITYKEGFISDTLQISASKRDSQLLTLRLDRRPVLTNRQLATGHVFRPAGDQYFLDFTAEVTDPDRNLDIEDVLCRIPDLGLSLSLFPDRDRMRWIRTAKFDSLLAVQTGGNSNAALDTLIGMPIFIDITTVTVNNDTAITRYGPFYLTRVISDEVILNSPKADTTVSRRPVFSWTVPATSFTFTSTVQIVWIASLSDLQYYRFRGVTATTLQPGFDLPVGNFFWTVEIRDSFGNWSRSREATFQTTDR